MYYKNTENGYIISICKGVSNGNITEAEYNTILSTIQNKPVTEEGYDYKLKEDLTWELYKLPDPPEPSPEDELSDGEALNIVTGA